ncbi:MAG: hypothetical protein ACFFC6_07465 [Promethearchaeota archaeon]
MVRIEELGFFKINDIQLMVSDPIHKYGDLVISPVKSGIWEAFVERRPWDYERELGMFNAVALFVCHESEIKTSLGDFIHYMEVHGGIFGGDYIGTIMVRSGQCSIYDPSRFPKGSQYDDQHKEWYQAIGRHRRDLEYSAGLCDPDEPEHVLMATIIWDTVVVDSGNGYFPVRVHQKHENVITAFGVEFL